MNRNDAPKTPATFHVKSFGCQMNVYDGERMAEMLGERGMTAADEGVQADLVILNTCHIREKAVDKVYSDIGRLTREDGTRPMIAVAGCVAQAEGSEISRRARSVDIVVGPQAYHNLPELIEKAGRGEEAVDTDMPLASKFGALPARTKQARPTAFLTIMEGCDKFCTYCVVPYTRGAEISRSWSAILDEAKALVDGGVREITLLGQNVNAWTGQDDKGRAQGMDGLVRELAKVNDLKRIRYTTSHPNDMSDGLIAAHGEVDKLMPFLHLPVQSGNDRILKAMNRSHSVESYLRIIDRVRTVRPDIALSGDFIVGFPGRNRCPVRRYDQNRRTGPLCPVLFVQIQPPPRHPSGGNGRTGPCRGDGRSAGAAAGSDQPASGGIQRDHRWTPHRNSAGTQGPSSGAVDRKNALASVSARHRAGTFHRRHGRSGYHQRRPEQSGRSTQQEEGRLNLLTVVPGIAGTHLRPCPPGSKGERWMAALAAATEVGRG